MELEYKIAASPKNLSYTRLETNSNINEKSLKVLSYFKALCELITNNNDIKLNEYLDGFINILNQCDEDEISIIPKESFECFLEFISRNFIIFGADIQEMAKILTLLNLVSFVCTGFAVYFVNSDLFHELRRFVFDHNSAFQSISIKIVANIFIDSDNTTKEAILDFIPACSLISIFSEQNKDIFLILYSITTSSLNRNFDFLKILEFANSVFEIYPIESLSLYTSLLTNQNIFLGYKFEAINEILYKLQNRNLNVSENQNEANYGVVLSLNIFSFISASYQRGIDCIKCSLNELLKLLIFSEHNEIKFAVSNAIYRICEFNNEKSMELDMKYIFDNFYSFEIIPKSNLGLSICYYFSNKNTTKEEICFYMNTKKESQQEKNNKNSLFEIFHVLLEIAVEPLIKGVIMTLDKLFQRFSLDPEFYQICSQCFLDEFPGEMFYEYISVEDEEIEKLGLNFLKKWFYSG